MKQENNSQLDELDKRILKFIFSMLHHPTSSDIERFFFPQIQPGTKKRYIQRKLQYLIEHHYIAFHLVHNPDHPSNERGYYLLAKGARAIGVTLNRQQYKPQKHGYYEMRKAKMELTQLAYKQGWKLYASEQSCMDKLIEIISIVEERKHGRKPLDADIRNILPPKVKPDLVMQTARGIYICTIASYQGEEQYFTRREAKYHTCRQYFGFIIITINDKQWLSAVKSLKAECAYLGADQEKGVPPLTNHDFFSKRFLIIRMEELEKLSSIIHSNAERSNHDAP